MSFDNLLRLNKEYQDSLNDMHVAFMEYFSNLENLLRQFIQESKETSPPPEDEHNSDFVELEDSELDEQSNDVMADHVLQVDGKSDSLECSNVQDYVLEDIHKTEPAVECFATLHDEISLSVSLVKECSKQNHVTDLQIHSFIPSLMTYGLINANTGCFSRAAEPLKHGLCTFIHSNPILPWKIDWGVRIFTVFVRLVWLVAWVCSNLWASFFKEGEN